MNKYTLMVVPHTHWDREWYKPFQVFRMKLVRTMDKLIELLDTNAEYGSFTFDGQTIILEDYVAIRPEMRERLKEYIRSGQILVGPWYILPDEFLVSGEAIIRNLMLGKRIAEEYGRSMRVGYVPDPFGHIAQLPQILQGFGLDSCIFTRGLGDEWEGIATEFNWESPDGTSVLAVFQMNSYGNAKYLGYDWRQSYFMKERYDGADLQHALGQVRSQIDKLGQKASTRLLLLNNGFDHLEPQPDLPSVIKYVNDHIEDAEVFQSTFEELIDGIKAEHPQLATIKGELTSGRFFPRLPGVLSTRIHIKQRNEITQSLLEKWAEPSCTLAWMLGKTYERAFLWEAWKLCIQNHPHDSICGCSIDQVHREMMPRFDQAEQIAEKLTEESLRYITTKIDTSFAGGSDGKTVVVFNGLNHDVDSVATRHYRIPTAQGDIKRFAKVKDASGQIVKSQISNYRPRDYSGDLLRAEPGCEFDVSFLAKGIPGLGFKSYVIELAADEREFESALSANATSAENSFIHVSINSDGSFDLLDKSTGRVYSRCNLFQDTDDSGDEYNYSPSENPKLFSTKDGRAQITVLENGPLFARFKIEVDFLLPKSLTKSRSGRSETLVTCPITSFVTVYAHSPRVDITTQVTNNAKDHRLRVIFPSPFPCDTHRTEGQFVVVERQNYPPQGDGWCEQPIGTNAQKSFVDVSDESGGMTVINRGLPEYEVIHSPEGCNVAITLLRCVGWLSRDDLRTRPDSAGPYLETPDAQCLGDWSFSYAILPHAATWEEDEIWKQAHEHNTPLRVVDAGRQPGSLPTEGSFVRLEGPGLIVSALKKAECSEDLILRLYNTTSTLREGRISFLMPIKEVRLVDLKEDPLDLEVVRNGDIFGLSVPPFRVITLQVSMR